MTPPSRPLPSSSAPAPIGDRARWIAGVLSDDVPATQRAAAEAALGRSRMGRRLLAVLASFDPPAAHANGEADTARVDRIMAAISLLAARDLPRVAEAVLEAWGDPAFREALRHDPTSVLRTRGVAVPAALQVHVVGPSDARFPSAELLELPLPPTTAPAVDRAAARQALTRSDFGWLFGQDPEAGARQATWRGPTWPSGWRRAFPRPAWALGALAAAVTLALWTARGTIGGGGLSGTAVGTPAAVALLVALAFLAAGMAWWWRRR